MCVYVFVYVSVHAVLVYLMEKKFKMPDDFAQA
jgi:hypothetical protein